MLLISVFVLDYFGLFQLSLLDLFQFLQKIFHYRENYNHSKDDMLEAMIEIIKNKQGEI